MLKAQKVRLYPNKEQQQIISSQIGGARYVYNRALALRKFAYSKFGLKIGKFALINHITKLKKREKTSWLKEIDSQAIQQSKQIWTKPINTFLKVVATLSSNQDTIQDKAINTHRGLKLRAIKYFYLKLDG